MNSSLKKDNILELFILLIYLVLFISLAFSFRAISSISVGLLFITGVVKNSPSLVSAFKNESKRALFIGLIIFFLLQFLSFFNNQNNSSVWKDIALKSSLVAIPVAIILTTPLSSKTRSRIIAGYCIILFAAALYCLLTAFANYSLQGDSSVFFYHSLAKPVHQHAVYFSIFIFVALAFQFESFRTKRKLFPPFIQISFLLFLSIFMILLSSKLVILFYIIYLAWYFLTQAKSLLLNRKTITALCIVLILSLSILLLTRNPVADRFRDMTTGNISLIQQDQFTPGNYFNGLQFRLLQWKLVSTILNEKNAWLTGVGSTKAQPLLDSQYASRNMYLGKPNSENHGYLGYNTHNQLLESLLKNGIPGAIAFLLVLFSMLKLSWQKKHSSYFFVLLLLSAYACVESVFETQYGIVLFVFFPFFLCMEE